MQPYWGISLRWATRQRAGRWGAVAFALAGLGVFGATVGRALWASAGQSTVPRWEAAVITGVLVVLWTLWGLLYSSCWSHRRQRKGLWVALGSGSAAAAGGALMPTVAGICSATCGTAAVGVGSLLGASAATAIAAVVPVLWIAMAGVLLMLVGRLARRIGKSLAETGQPGC